MKLLFVEQKKNAGKKNKQKKPHTHKKPRNKKCLITLIHCIWIKKEQIFALESQGEKKILFSAQNN